MRIAILGFLFACVSVVSADEVVTLDGSVVQGRVESVQVEGRGVMAGDQLLAVRLSADRTLIDANWIERLLRFALDRARRDVKNDGSIGVYVGRGVSAPSAMAVVRRLDERKHAPRLLFESDMTADGLKGLDAIVVPGGWAPSELSGMAQAGQAALADFVQKGGGYLGICAGGYVPCFDVVWEGVRYPYPMGLAKGTATGPVPDLVPWPQAQSVQLTLAGRKTMALYAGGASYTIQGATILARYPNRSTAAVEVRHGKGRLVLTGAHVEFDGEKDADLLDGWATGVQPGDAKLFHALLKRVVR